MSEGPIPRCLFSLAFMIASSPRMAVLYQQMNWADHALLLSLLLSSFPPFLFLFPSWPSPEPLPPPFFYLPPTPCHLSPNPLPLLSTLYPPFSSRRLPSLSSSHYLCVFYLTPGHPFRLHTCQGGCWGKINTAG